MKKLFLIYTGLILVCAPAWAHEKRTVGDYELIVGFLNEPAFSGQLNAVDLRVAKKGKPVTGLEDTVRASIFRGADSRPVELKPKYGEPGAYAGYFIPSEPGDYSFRFEGKIGETVIGEKFNSADGKFSPVADSSTLVFPGEKKK